MTRGKTLSSDHLLAVLAAMMLVGSVGVMTLQQQAYAPRECPGCGPFLELSAQFERDVGQSILEFAVENHPNNIPYGEFKKLTGQFKTDFINELMQAPPEPVKLRALLEAYGDGIDRILLGGPDTIPELFQKHKGNIYVVYNLNND